MRHIISALIFSFSLLGQQSGDYSITGTTLNAQTGEPVKYALITLTGSLDPSRQEEPSKPQIPIRKSTQAGVAGEFQFSGLPKAHYIISAQKPGFNQQFSPDAVASRDWS